MRDALWGPELEAAEAEDSHGPSFVRRAAATVSVSAQGSQDSVRLQGGPADGGGREWPVLTGIRGGGGSIRIADLDSKGRATGIRARLNPNAINQGTSASSRMKLPGFRRGKDNRTHLLAKELGGQGTRRNIVVAGRKFNQVKMRVPERIARRALERGEDIIYEAIPEYVPGRRRPIAVHVRVTVDRKGKGSNNILFDQRIAGTR